MIDLFALEAPLLLALLWILRKRRDPDRLLWPAAGLAALFHALAVLAVFLAPVPDFSFTARLSPAYVASVRGGGKVLKVNGRAPESFGRLLSALFAGAENRIEATNGSFIAPPCAFGRRPWEGTDSYAVEEASGGLILTERQPVMLSRGGDNLILQITSQDTAGGVRIERAAGQRVRTVRDLFGAIGAMPAAGVTPLRIMRPSPDDNVSTVLFSPSMMPPAPGAGEESGEDRLVRGLGLTGVFTLLETSHTSPMLGFPEAVSARPVWAARGLIRSYEEALGERGEADFRFRNAEGVLFRPADAARILLRPRVQLLPWVGGDAFTSWALGALFAPARQLLGLARMPRVFAHWGFVPRQLYNLDDAPFSAPGFVFLRLASFFVSGFLALIAWRVLRRRLFQSGPAPGAAARAAILFLLVAALQLGDLLVIISAG